MRMNAGVSDDACCMHLIECKGGGRCQGIIVICRPAKVVLCVSVSLTNFQSFLRLGDLPFVNPPPYPIQLRQVLPQWLPIAPQRSYSIVGPVKLPEKYNFMMSEFV